MRLKKMNYLVLLTLTLVLNYSCDDDEDCCVLNDDEVVTEDRAELIVGTWRLTKYETDQAVDENHDGEYNTNILAFEFDDCEMDDDWVFTDGDEKLFYRKDDHISGATCHPDGISYVEFEYYWELSEDLESLLIARDNDGTTDSTLEIISFSTNKIEVQFEEERTLEDDSEAIVNTTLVLERLL